MYGANFNDRQLELASDGATTAHAPNPLEEQGAARGSFDCVAVTKAIQRALAAAERPDLWLAVPPALDAAALGIVLQELLLAGVQVQGFVDSATVLAASQRLAGNVLLLDISQHRTTVSVVTMHADAAELRRTVLLDGGMAGLVSSWVQLAAKTLVQQTRFDPLHNSRSESELRARLPLMAAEAQRDGYAMILIETGSDSQRLELTRDQFAAASSEQMRPIASTLQALTAALGDCSLLVTDLVADLPGFDVVVAGAQLQSAYVVPTSAIACAASLLPRAQTDNPAAVQYLTKIPIMATQSNGTTMLPLRVTGPATSISATHIVYRGRALAISEAGILLGRGATGERALQLPDGLAGVSRRHCTIWRDAGRSIVIDHSSHGTFIDGVRVRGRALLGAGATLRVGDPGIEFPLVVLDAPSA
jgi:FHA domain